MMRVLAIARPGANVSIGVGIARQMPPTRFKSSALHKNPSASGSSSSSSAATTRVTTTSTKKVSSSTASVAANPGADIATNSLARAAVKALRAVGLGPTARRRAQEKFMRTRQNEKQLQQRLREAETDASHSAATVKRAERAAEDARAASDRTHSYNTRLSLSRNSLVLRFSNENSYLNWARNGVLSSGVGVAMYAQEHHRGAQLSGAGLLLLGFGYIGVGTAKYIYYILRFRQVMELSWGSVIGAISHASIALMIWLTATASFLESVPLELDAMLLTEPIASFLPFRIRQGLIETYSLYLDDLEHHNDEQERVLRAIQREKEEALAAKELQIIEAAVDQNFEGAGADVEVALPWTGPE